MSVKNYGTANLMFQYLPEIYRVNYENSFSGLEEYDNADLQNFLKIFAFEHDYLKTMAENAKHRYNALKVDGRMLPGLLNEFGFVYEKELGLQQARKLFANAAAIYTKKGSLAGVKNFATAFSGYNATTLPVKNLMLNVNDSSFETSIGSWDTTVNGTLSAISGAAESPIVPPYAESTAPSNFPSAQAGLLKAVATAAGDVTFTCGTPAPKTKGIPVTGGLKYSFSIYSRAKTATKSIFVTVYWYDRDGAFISSDTGASTTNSTSTWTRISLANITAPSNAYFAVPYVKITSALASEVHYFDAAQFEQSTTVTNFVDARRIDILLNANRINLVANPSFEVNTNGWASAQTSVVKSTAFSYSGTGCAATAITNATDNNILAASWLPSTAGTYTYSVYFYIPTGSTLAGRTVGITLEGTVTGITVVTSTPATLAIGAWNRASITFTTTASTPTSGYGIVARYSGTIATAIGQTIYSDAALLEQSSTVNPYFDGSKGYYQTGDLLWENGTPNAGRSFYYKNYQTVTKRLITVLPDYLPFGAPWALFVAQTP